MSKIKQVLIRNKDICVPPEKYTYRGRNISFALGSYENEKRNEQRRKEWLEYLKSVELNYNSTYEEVQDFFDKYQDHVRNCTGNPTHIIMRGLTVKY